MQQEQCVVSFLDVGLDAAEIHGAENHWLRALDQLEVTEGGEFNGAVLKSVGGLVDDEDVEDDVVLVDVHVGLGVHGVGEAGQLGDLLQK